EWEHRSTMPLQPLSPDSVRWKQKLAGESFRSWLSAVDVCSGGELAACQALQLYQEIFASNFDSVEQLVSIYAAPGEDGQRAWNVQLFDDVGVSEEHVQHFDTWLRSVAVRASQNLDPADDEEHPAEALPPVSLIRE
ncbi:unnamed protein product, partial [Polarella glacialis]